MCGISRLPRQPGRRGFAGQTIHDITAAASLAAGQHWPAPTAALPQRSMMIPPRTIQLCLHRRHRPAGSRASHTTGQTTRRPWRLPCRQRLDLGVWHVIPSGGHAGPGR